MSRILVNVSAGAVSFLKVKGTKEMIGVFKALQEGGFDRFHGALFQIITSRFTAPGGASPPWRLARSRPTALSEDRVRRPQNHLAGSQIPGPSWGRDAAILVTPVR